ncbi:MAG: PAS domain-containing protein [Phycisphaerales bacterium]|nr:PAS domain-containing protein [Phycisphaerales bacterium]
MNRPKPSGVERYFDEGELIVSKTDLKGHITYANLVFQRVAEYTEEELLGKPHSIIRHPAMPRCVFRFLWDRIADGHEVFAYVINLCKSGAHYWVFAHVTPTFNQQGKIIGYHSSRRVPSRAALDQIKPIYDDLLRIESRHRLPREQWEASLPALVAKLESIGKTYDELIFDLCAA